MLEEVPTVVRVIPCTTALIGVTAASILLIGKTIRVTAKVASTYSAKLIVKVIV